MLLIRRSAFKPTQSGYAQGLPDLRNRNNDGPLEPEKTMPLNTEQCTPEVVKLDEVEANMLSTELCDWIIVNDTLEKTFRFKNFHDTMAFTNAVAYVAHQQNHHPDLNISYSRCKLIWNTHSVGGLSRNDFICAARVDSLVKAS
jgi:4a-hydroxytetrahydrobiopterin dehydratase